jgi:hypothetical protein
MIAMPTKSKRNRHARPEQDSAPIANPIVQRAEFLGDVPFEEVVIPLMTRQLTIPPQVLPADDGRADGEQ